MFSVSGRGSVIQCDVFPPLDLPPNGDWEIGLVNLTTYNTIPNVEKDVNDAIHFGSIDAPTHHKASADGEVFTHIALPPAARSVITANYSDTDKSILEKEDKTKSSVTVIFPQGAYELQDLERYVVETCSRANIPLDFKLKANNNTLRSEIFSSRSIDFTRTANIAAMLGFKPRVLEPNKWHISDTVVNIIRVNIIRLVCNIVRGSYDNGVENHILHEFPLAVDPGYKIIETPSNVIYLPINTNRIQSIVIRLEDQDGNLVNFQNEVISLRLHSRLR